MTEQKPHLNFRGSDWALDCADVADETFLQDLIDCGGGGDALPAVQYVLQTYNVAGDPADCREYLKGYGAWEDDELADHAANLERLVWLTGCALAEQHCGALDHGAYFCAY